MSSLPISKTLEEIRSELFGHIQDVQEEYVAKGWLPSRINLNQGIVRGLIEIWAWGLYQLYQFLAFILQQAVPAAATGKWLDVHAEQVEIERKSATKAKGKVVLTGDESGNVPVPAGRIFKTKPDSLGSVYRFVSTEGVILADGETEIEAAVEAEEYGRASNVAAGQITQITTTIPGVHEVTNTAEWLTSEGMDIETDSSLQQRYFLRWLENNGLTKYAYASWAMSVTGVVAVKVLDNHPRGQGSVDVVIKGSAGLPTSRLIDDVSVVIEANKAVNDDVLVKSPVPVNIDIDAQLELVSGDPDTIVPDAENKLRMLFEASSFETDAFQIGDDLILDRLIGAVMQPDIKRINWVSPAQDITIDDADLAVLQSLTLTWVWADDR